MSRLFPRTGNSQSHHNSTCDSSISRIKLLWVSKCTQACTTSTSIQQNDRCFITDKITTHHRKSQEVSEGDSLYSILILLNFDSIHMVIFRYTFATQINECDYIGWQCARLNPPQSAFRLDIVRNDEMCWRFVWFAAAVVLLCKLMRTDSKNISMWSMTKCYTFCIHFNRFPLLPPPHINTLHVEGLHAKFIITQMPIVSIHCTPTICFECRCASWNTRFDMSFQNKK